MTVVEIIVSLVVAGFLTLALHGIVTTHLYISQRNRDLVLANSFAEGQIEAQRSIGFLGLSNGSSDLTAQLPSELGSPRSATLTISSQAGDIKLLDLAISYSEQGRIQTFNYRTFVGELGVGQY